jgi:hypothetical protein
VTELLAQARDQLRNCDGDEKEQPADDHERIGIETGQLQE